MSKLQGGALAPDEPARRADSPWIASDAAEPPQSRVAAIAAELKDSLAREAALLHRKDEILQRQAMLTQEFEHRLANSLQLIVGLLTQQSRQTESREAAEQLMIAANRVGAFGRVHRQLHLLELADTVELKQFVTQLCQDISRMLFEGKSPRPVVVGGAHIEVPTTLGVPLGFIVNELVTNAAKHSKGTITVRLETTPALGHSLSVSNGGPPLSDQIHPGSSKGLGLTIIQSLVEEINGRLEIGQGPGREGSCFRVFFPSGPAT
jgi:two-component sensor histidine kinase